MSESKLTIRISAQGAAQAQATIQNVANAASSMMRNLAAAAGVVGFGAALQKVARIGIGFNATMEDAALGIAAVQKQFNPERFANFEDAITEAWQAIDLLKEKAKTSPASFQELVSGFQAVSGAATSAGIDMRRQVDLIVLMSQALSGLGIRSEQLIQESRALISGNINEDAAAARILGITKAQIDQAREAGQLFEFLTGKLEAFREAGERGTSNFRTMVSNVRDGFEQAAAEATKPIFDILKDGLQGVLSLDWEGAGKRIGAFIALGINSIEGGTLPQFLGLVIEAGFELGISGANRVFNRFLDWLSSPNPWRAVAHAFISVWEQVHQMIAVMSAQGVRNTAATFVQIGNLIQSAVIGAFNALSDQVNDILKNITTAWNMVTGSNLPALQVGKIQGFDLSGIENSVNSVMDSYVQALFAAIESVANKFRALIGNGVPFSDNQPALAQLTAQIEAMLEAAKKLTTVNNSPTPTDTKKKFISAVEMERQLKAQLLGLEQARANLENDFTKTAVEKYRQKVALIQQERDALGDIIQYLRDQAALATDDAARQQLLGRADQFERQFTGLGRDRAQMGADPESLGQTMVDAMTRLQDQFGTTAQIIARGFSSTIQSAVDGVASSISGLLNLTMTWGEALRNIGQSILQGVINAISRMFAEWIAKRTLMALKDIALNKLQAAAGAGPALMESIKSYGVAAAVGAAALAAVMAATGGFADGGYTGDGPRNQVAGAVHRGEYVFSAPAVQRLGIDNLEALHEGRGMAGNGGSGLQRVSVAVFNDPAQYARFIRENPEAEEAVVDVMRRNLWRVQS